MDTLYLKTGIHGIAPPISVGGALEVRTNAAQQVSAVGRSAADKSTGAAPPPQKGAAASFRFFSFGHPLKSLWPGLGGGGSGGSANSKMYKGITLDDAVLVENGPGGEKGRENETRIRTSGQNGNWLLKILHVRSLWRDRVKQGQESEKGEDAVNGQPNSNNEEDEEECDDCRIDDSEREVEFDRDSFSRLLKRVSLAEAKLYAQMSYLGSLAYSIPNIKPGNLLKYRGLRFVTSSVEQKELAMKAEKNQVSSEKQEAESKTEVEAEKEHKNSGYRISSSSAYHIAATAASYLHSHTRVILSLKSSKADGGEDSTDGGSGSDDTVNMMKSEIASLMATTDSVTAVVAAKEEVKQAVADDLKSTHSSPSEWFICDDDQSGTRFFVIQGSGSLASWKANLLFEPIQFEGFDVLVHRGIYEAAKGIYEQMLPEVHAHLKARGNHATFRFTGHSLGGSLSLLVNLMLQIRGEVPASALLPVITFGAPSIMCGGDHLLHKLGLPKCHVQAVTMHRDIVPRAFSCNYPNHVAELLKAVNGNFRNHPCLNNQKLLYAPMGELLILQPEEKFSPQHPLLPSGSGLYILSRPLLLETSDAEKQLRSAQLIFLNSPHPLEILSDRSAYGSKGTIQRDHHMNSYLKSVWSVVRHEQNRFRKARREHRRELWWPLVQSQGINGGGIVVERPVASVKLGGFKFSGILQTGRESLKRFSRLVASQHMHLLVVLLFPARLILVGAYNVISF